MDSIVNVNWDTVDWDLEVANYIRMPDGTQRILTMSMLHWYWVQFMEEHGETRFRDLIRDALKAMEIEYTPTDPDWDEDFDYLVKHGIMAWARSWIELTEGR